MSRSPSRHEAPGLGLLDPGSDPRSPRGARTAPDRSGPGSPAAAFDVGARIPLPRRPPPERPAPAVPTGSRPAPSRPPGHPGGVGRIGLHLLLAGAPLLAISAQVFELVAMRTVLAVLIVPAVMVVAALALFAPHGSDRVVLPGLGWGVVACLLYDAFRLDTVYLLGWWGDFIPTMGSWVTGGRPGDMDGVLVGYLWRYLGDGGGIGITFFVLAAATGLGRRGRRDAVCAGVGFAVFPVWTGLIATVALAPRGEEMMFPLTPTTVTLSLIGHLIFGGVLGLGFARSRRLQAAWPWPPVRIAPSELARLVRDARRPGPGDRPPRPRRAREERPRHGRAQRPPARRHARRAAPERDLPVDP